MHKTSYGTGWKAPMEILVDKLNVSQPAPTVRLIPVLTLNAEKTKLSQRCFTILDYIFILIILTSMSLLRSIYPPIAL